MPAEYGFRSFDDDMKARFGKKIYRLSLDGGMTCPNRDGTLGTGGCIFCSGSGSGEFSAGPQGSVSEQIERAKALVRRKANSCGYMAYFQNFTNTYAPVEKLRTLFDAVLDCEDVYALSVATRPDCLEPEKLDLLAEMASRKPVWVELGLQTVHNSTAEYIRRRCPLSAFNAAVPVLRGAGIHVVLHMIIGLPGETPEMMLQTADYIADSGADGIKFHLLHVLRGTDLAADYLAGRFQTLELDAYIDLLEACIRRIPPEVTVHRLTGDGAKSALIAPLWSADKKRVLNEIHRRFRLDGVRQGTDFVARRQEKTFFGH